MFFRSLTLSLLSFFAASAALGAEHLREEKSSFLQAHVIDEIDWMPWGEAAFDRAKVEKKPIYLCIGAFTNELSRAMQKQSFSNEKVIALLKHDFVCVLVDRDERPDLAALFQAYLRAAKQLNGWPANIWLTPEVKPFEGATYLPPSEEWGKEGLLNVLQRVTASWKTSSQSNVQQANEGVASTAASETFEPGPVFATKAVVETLEKNRETILSSVTPAHGPIEDATGHVDPELLRWLLQSPGVGREAALQSLRALDRSALHDPLDGGFFHRAVSPATQFPSFQKFLGDQVRLALAFLDGAKVSDDPIFSSAARSTLDYVLLKLVRSDGTAIHAEDGTPEELTASFGWSETEILSLLGDKNGHEFELAYGIKAEGNISPEDDTGNKWKEKNLLIRGASVTDEATEKRFAEDRAKLLAARNQRPQPLRDENVLIGENGLLLEALSKAGRQLKEPRYETTARQLATFLETHSEDKDGRLFRLSGNDALAAPEDYAALACGWIAFGRAEGKDSFISTAKKLLQKQEKELFDVKVGRYFAQYASTPHLFLRSHALDPQPGDFLGAEASTLLAGAELEEGPRRQPPTLLRTLTADLASPDGVPRGDVLLAAARLARLSEEKN